MGGAVSVNNEVARSEGYLHNSRYNDLIRGMSSTNLGDSQMSLPMVALRQLSQNLIRQDHHDQQKLYQYRHSRSVPKFSHGDDDENLRRAMSCDGNGFQSYASVGDLLSEQDMAIIADDFSIMDNVDNDPTLHTGSVEAAAAAASAERYNRDNLNLGFSFGGSSREAMSIAATIQKANAVERQMERETSAKSLKFVSQTPPISSPSVSTDPQPLPPGTKPRLSKKPNLFLHVDSETALGSTPNGPPPQNVPVLPSPGSAAHVSPRGTLYVGNLQIRETGIFAAGDAVVGGSEGSQRVRGNAPVISKGDDHQSSPRLPDYELAKRRFSGLPARPSDGSEKDDFSFAQALGNGTFGPAMACGKSEFMEIGILGSGASGVVTEAIHMPSMTLVALKMLPVYNQEKRRHVSRELQVLFQNLSEMRAKEAKDGEGGAVTGGRCPNVLSLYNAFVDPKSGLINLVIEYMDGGSLDDLVKQGGCQDERLLADISRQTLRGLSFLHRNKSVHRDIKPANILCSSTGLVKIADFGISKALDKSTGFTNTFVGTVCYMSPERIAGGNHTYSCDIWSFGLTILAVAKGHFPLVLRDKAGAGSDGDSKTVAGDGEKGGVVGGASGYWAVMKAICDDEPPRAGKEFSPEFNAFIDDCLRKDPKQRVSADELLDSKYLTSFYPVITDFPSPRSDNSESVSGKHFSDTEQSGLSQHIVAVATRTAAPSGDGAVDGEDGDGALDNESVIQTIRMAHLARLLEQIVRKLDVDDIDLFMDLPSDRYVNGASAIKKVTNDGNDSDSSVESLDKMVITAAPERPAPVAKAPSHSILRVSNRNTDSNDAGGEHEDNVDDRRSRFAASNTASINRSVQFNDSVESLDGQPLGARSALRDHSSRGLHLTIDEDASGSSGSVLGRLPKTSSYFLSSQGRFDDVAMKKAREEQRAAKRAQVEALRRNLPGFDSAGSKIWFNLAHQLQLPCKLVLLEAESRLKHLLNPKSS